VRRFCDDACRAWWHSEARRRGAKAMARAVRQRRQARPRVRLTAAEAHQVAAMIAIGSMVTGIPIPHSAFRIPHSEGAR
jgi:hypothetical protein